MLWHERDISHSSAERVILPDSTIALHFMLAEMHEVLEGLEVYPERMRENLQVGGGLAFSQNVLLALVDAGLARDEAYAIVQTAAAAAWDEGASFRERARRGRPRARTDRRPARRAVRPGGGAAEPRRRVRPAREGRGPPGMSGTAARLHGQGKVRDIYDVGDDRVLLVATDRISAFDVVLPDPIPDKGRVLTGLTLFWLERTTDVVPNHLASADRRDFPEPFRSEPALAGRAMLASRAEVIPVECVVRGYLTGSGLKQYRAEGQVCGVALPAGSGRVVEAPGADLHADDEGRRRARPAAHVRRDGGPGRAAGSRSVCARSRSPCTSGGRGSPQNAGSFSPTRSSSSGSPTAS